MLFNKWLYTILSSVLLSISHAQDRTIYLGPYADSIFISDLVTGTDSLNFSDSKTLFRFFDYQTFHHGITDKSGKQNVNRDGVLLEAKRTEILFLNGESYFGKKGDTCLITYEAEIEKITTGRSAAISLLNLFSKKSDKNPQEEPSSHIRYIRIKGKILLNDGAADFEYSNNLNKDYNLAKISGKVWHGSDSLLLQPAREYLNKKGKKKKGYAGYKLAKGENIFGAVDPFAGTTNIIYINKAISEKEKLVTAAYFFIVRCYMQYPPPFIDMTPQ